ncbi:hypothetical protein IWQ60_008885 [Tieghemiomyces parasiticus]|uniref:(d)CMP kinase n=1 Tax=Tieghemiomyces parasiticus TaxID=78921 RepID=A0A9W7ZVV8_9FUNG|nr:hypothetical protein IWQ60_008885 [Tieghemiomyces parasiticus]
MLGSIYRAITLKALAQGLDLTQEADRQRLDGLAHTCQVDTQAQFDGDTLRVVTYLDGQDVTDAIRTLAVNRGVSEVAKAPEVRQAVLQIQRRMAGYKREGSETTTDKLSTTDLVMDGRDIGTSVFPQAELKVYLEADAAVRAQRRYEEMQRQAMAKKENRSTLPTYDEVLRDLQARDAADVNRTHSPLRRAPDAVVIDSTNLTIDQQVNKIVELAQSRMA